MKSKKEVSNRQQVISVKEGGRGVVLKTYYLKLTTYRCDQ